MLMEFQFDYEQVERVKAMSPEGYARLREVADLPENASEIWSGKRFTGNIELVIEIVGPVTATGKMTPWLMHQLIALNERIDMIAKQNVERSVNHKIDVHVPNLGLLTVDEVCVREDHCTDALQEDLTDGWRILAVLPQPDQRRPDYVLGRTKNRN